VQCPYCGEKTLDGSECKKCSKGVVPQKELGVHYKEFKLAELLDIKIMRPAFPKRQMKADEPATRDDNRPDSTGHVEGKQLKRKPHIAIFAFVALLAAMAFFYLLRYLF